MSKRGETTLATPARRDLVMGSLGVMEGALLRDGLFELPGVGAPPKTRG